MAPALTACSFCGQAAADVKQLFENEEHTAAICDACVKMFAENVTAGESVEE